MGNQRGQFTTLHGLRGIAALAILFWHLAPAHPSIPTPKSAYLSVDLFFMLSGFVIASAYEDRLRAGWRARDFLAARFIRLYPLYILGVAIGCALPIWTLVTNHFEIWRLKETAHALPWAIVLLPYPTWADGQSFVLNPPAWSLFFEAAINIAYVFALPMLTTRRLVLLSAISGIGYGAAICYWGGGNIGTSGIKLLGGAARVGLAFPVGLLLMRLYRAGKIPRVAGGMLMAPALMLLLEMPATQAMPEAIVAVPIIALGFTTVVLLGVGSEPHGVLRAVYAKLGWLSYPLYATHIPVLSLVRAIADRSGADAITGDVVAVAIVFLVAWLAGRFYDPVARRTLSAALSLRRRDVTKAPAL